MRRVDSPAIEAKGLRKVYGQKVALEDLTLRIERGEVFGFLGPNGAGKTTAVKILVGLAYPTAGSVRVMGGPPGDIRVRRTIGFLPEHFKFHDWLRAAELLDFHGQLCGMPALERQRRISYVLELVSLGERAQDRLSTFSKGMLQRIGIAQALLHQPDILFLDEPTSALDPLGRRLVRDLISGLKAEGATIFLNSHLLSEVERVCDHVAIIDRGRVVRAGPLASLLQEELELELRLEGITPALLEALGRLGSLVRADDSHVSLRLKEEALVPRVAETVLAHQGRLLAMMPRQLSLEGLFLKVVQGGGSG